MLDLKGKDRVRVAALIDQAGVAVYSMAFCEGGLESCPGPDHRPAKRGT
jgi:hypothetical protein